MSQKILNKMLYKSEFKVPKLVAFDFNRMSIRL